jgi:hypothetical protein
MKKSVLKLVENKILNKRNQDKIWSYSDFKDLPFDSVTKSLSLLNQKGTIKRIQKGYYFLPQRTILGSVPHDAMDLLLKKLDQKNVFYCVSGINGYNKIGLTTQISNITTIATTSPMRSNEKVKFIQRNKPASGTEIERIVLDALSDIDNIPGTYPEKALLKIKEIIKSDKVNINDLGKTSLNEIPRVRAIVGALGQELDMDKSLLKQLKLSINPGTVYLLDIDSVLKFAKEWNIKRRSHEIPKRA